MPKFSKGHNSAENFLRNLFKGKSGDLHVIPYQVSKFQTPS